MPRFFLPPETLNADFVRIAGEDARHIALSLRMAVGDPLILCDGQGTDYQGRICAINSQNVTVEILSSAPNLSEPPCFITLYQCVAKGEKMDYAVQKAVEFGVCRIVPVESERCIAKISPDGVQKKVSRWQKIADEAAGQCGRGILPKIAYPMGYAEAMERMREDSLAFLCYEGGGTAPLPVLLPERPVQSLSFLIGPEGGIAPGEVALAESAGICLCGLGKRILRTESAAIFVLSCLSCRWEFQQIDGERR